MRATVLALLLLASPAFAASGNDGVPERLAALEARIVELEADRDACRADLDAIDAEVDAIDEDVLTLEEDVLTLEGVVYEGLESMRRYQDLVDEVLERIEVHEPDWTNFDDRMDAVELEVADFRETLASTLDCLVAWMGGENTTCDAATANIPPEQG